MKKLASLTLAALLLASPAAGEIVAHKFAPASNKSNIYNLEIVIDIENTNWVAWNTAPSLIGGLLGPASVEPYILIAVANPSIQVSNRLFNDMTGPRSVLYGNAATTPDVSRIEGDTVAIYDEGGTFNQLFNQSGLYWFEFHPGEEFLPTFHSAHPLCDASPRPPHLGRLSYAGQASQVGSPT